VLIRREIAKLPGGGEAFYRHGADAAAPHQPARELGGLFPSDHRLGYEAEEVLARLVDQSLFWEILPARGRELVTGIGRVDGLYMGFVINRQGLMDDPEHRGQKKPLGILYKEGIAKCAAFSRACNDDGIPIVWMQDISGFDIGVEAERLGLVQWSVPRRCCFPGSGSVGAAWLAPAPWSPPTPGSPTACVCCATTARGPSTTTRCRA